MRDSAPCEIFFALLLHLYIQKNKSMHSQIRILFDAIIKAVWFPGIGEENKRHSLTEVVELQATSPYSVHDGGIVDDMNGDIEATGTKDDVGVRRCAVDTEGC